MGALLDLLAPPRCPACETVAGGAGWCSPCLLRLADLDAYRAVEREPLWGSYRGHRIATMPPASGGGLGILATLNLLEHSHRAAFGAGGAAARHHFPLATKGAWRDRARHAGDSGFVEVPLAGLVSKDYASRRAALLSPARSAPVDTVEAGDPWPYESPETTHFSVVDAEGNAVSNTYTIGSDFGSGVVIEGPGFLVGNVIGNFSLAEQAAGRREGRQRTANELVPGRRPVSSMAPTIVFLDDRPWLVTGSPGGNTIHGTVVQTIVGVVDFGLGIAESASLPRVHQEMRGDGELRFERGISPDTLRILSGYGHRMVPGETIGSTQTLLLRGDRIEGAADPRRPGAAAVAE
jgi:gamma-glutamyltranspeptidase / glutathione hydrolase